MKIEIKITYNRNLNEYCVGWYEDGRKSNVKSYFTDDKQDAEDTKVKMKQEAELEMMRTAA